LLVVAGVDTLRVAIQAVVAVVAVYLLVLQVWLRVLQ
jgi:hypothetical protein